MIREGSLKTTAIDDDLDPFNVDPNPDEVADGDPFADDHEVPQQPAARRARFGAGTVDALKHLLRGRGKLDADSATPTVVDDPFGDDLTPLAYNDDPFGDTPQELQAADAVATPQERTQVSYTEELPADVAIAERELRAAVNVARGGADGHSSRAAAEVNHVVGDSATFYQAAGALTSNSEGLKLPDETIRRLQEAKTSYEKTAFK